MFEHALRHLRSTGGLVVSTPAGDLRITADPDVDQIYVRDPELVFWFSFIPWFGEVRARARRQIQGGELETLMLRVQPAETTTRFFAQMVKLCSAYMLRVRDGR